jgi:hypothetical protein
MIQAKVVPRIREHLAKIIARTVFRRTFPPDRQIRLRLLREKWADRSRMAGEAKPPWELKYPGRLAFELDALLAAGATYTIDEEAAAYGKLALSIVWSPDNHPIKLKARYPDGFPRLRPIVLLDEECSKYPLRHCSPIDGTLCLLGRESRQWQSDWTLAELLSNQLNDALNGSGDEDEQGEPDEYWWHSQSLPNCYILVDSDWAVNNGSGDLQITFIARFTAEYPQFKAFASFEQHCNGEKKQAVPFMIPSDLQESKNAVRIPYEAIDGRVTPVDSKAMPAHLWSLVEKYGLRSRAKKNQASPNHFFQLMGLCCDSELSFKEAGRSWIFILIWGSGKDFRHNHDLKIASVRALRAGPTDIGIRSPVFRTFGTKSVALFGAGALGSTVALELARNGTRQIRILDRDVVEPGNAVRWAIGASALNQEKVRALSRFISEEYPYSEVVIVEHPIGGFSGTNSETGDDAILNDMLNGADLVIDATVEFGPTNLIADYCRSQGLPFVSCYATLGVGGGAVSFFHPDGACPVCLECHYQGGSIAPPPVGATGLIQPAGCSERTFSGASFDLSEIGLQTVRLLASVAGEIPPVSFTATLYYREQLSTVIPVWEAVTIEKHPNCAAH